MPTKQSRNIPFGTHVVRVEGDSVFFTSRGDLTAEDIRRLGALFREIREREHQLFVLYDARLGNGLDPRARKFAAQCHASDFRANLHLAFGVSFAARVLMTMIHRGQTLLGRAPTPIHVVETEEEALALFDAERERIRAELGHSKQASNVDSR